VAAVAAASGGSGSSPHNEGPDEVDETEHLVDVDVDDDDDDEVVRNFDVDVEDLLGSDDSIESEDVGIVMRKTTARGSWSGRLGAGNAPSGSKSAHGLD